MSRQPPQKSAPQQPPQQRQPEQSQWTTVHCSNRPEADQLLEHLFTMGRSLLEKVALTSTTTGSSTPGDASQARGQVGRVGMISGVVKCA